MMTYIFSTPRPASSPVSAIHFCKACCRFASPSASLFLVLAFWVRWFFASMIFRSFTSFLFHGLGSHLWACTMAHRWHKWVCCLHPCVLEVVYACICAFFASLYVHAHSKWRIHVYVKTVCWPVVIYIVPISLSHLAAVHTMLWQPAELARHLPMQD